MVVTAPLLTPSSSLTPPLFPPSPPQLDTATSYDDRSELRRAIRKLKSGGDSKKKVGSSNYRRAGYQAHIKLAIPNSVTGNVLPNKVSTDNLSKVEVPQSKATTSYLKGGKSGASTKKPADSQRDSVSSCTSEPGMNGRKVSVASSFLHYRVASLVYSCCLCVCVS